MDKKTKLLIVDDDINLLTILKLRLAPQNFEIETALNGFDALEKVMYFNPEVILLDIVMPKKNGYEVTETLKSNPQFKHIPIILFSGSDFDNEPKKAKEIGADQFILKSSINDNFPEFIQKINTCATA